MNNNNIFKLIGATNHSLQQRADYDFYNTDPKAIIELLKYEKFSENIWECACGIGNLSKVLEQNNYKVKSTEKQKLLGNIKFLLHDIKSFEV